MTGERRRIATPPAYFGKRSFSIGYFMNARILCIVTVTGLSLATSALSAQTVTPPMPIPRPAKLLQTPTIPMPAAPVAARSAAAGAIARAAAPPKVATLDAATIVQKAGAFLNATVVMTADFVQLGADGRRLEGKLYVQKPGRVRFDYNPPATLQIISDGSSVAIRDKKLATQDLYFVSQTPLKFLLTEKLDLGSDVKILDVASDERSAAILVEDKATFGGTSKIRMVFDPVTFALEQWTVTDPQGYDTVVTLSNVDTRTTPDPGLFKINFERFKD